MSEYIAKAPIEPRDYRVVFLIQQKSVCKYRHSSIHELVGFSPAVMLSPALPDVHREYKVEQRNHT